jgi:hypothetical protein
LLSGGSFWAKPCMEVETDIISTRSTQAHILERSASRPAADIRHNSQFKHGDIREIELVFLDFANCVGWIEVPTAGAQFLERIALYPQTIARRILACVAFVLPRRAAKCLLVFGADRRLGELFGFQQKPHASPDFSPDNSADSTGKPSVSDVTSTTADTGRTANLTFSGTRLVLATLRPIRGLTRATRHLFRSFTGGTPESHLPTAANPSRIRSIQHLAPGLRTFIWLRVTRKKVDIVVPFEVDPDNDIGTFFNRAVVSSQAFSDLKQREKLEGQMDWLANGLQNAFTSFLKDASSVKCATYDLTDNRWVIPDLDAISGKLSLLYYLKNAKDPKNQDLKESCSRSALKKTWSREVRFSRTEKDEHHAP